MEAKDLKAIIEQVLQEMNVSSDEKTTAAVAAATEAAAPKAVASEGISLKIPKKGVEPVSYTHLDVYKRQHLHHPE